MGGGEEEWGVTVFRGNENVQKWVMVTELVNIPNV